LVAVTNVTTTAIVLQEVAVTPQWAQEAASPAGVMEWRYDYVSRLARLGWQCTMHHPLVTDEPNRPSAVMMFRKAN
jgi:hypothetical protein